MIQVTRLLDLHRETVEQWHRQEMSNPYDGVWELVCQQHSYNFLLWHEEDIARSRDVSDGKIAEVKRNIDRYNQQRNDWIEKIDDWITAYLIEAGPVPAMGAPLNTETPGSVIDRLSILALRIYHLHEQTDRADVGADHLRGVQQKLGTCREQLADLSGALRELLVDITAGRKRHKTYRQFKMYNDPSLNPYLYQSSELRRAG